MIQKLLKVGSSVAVTIPKKSLPELGLTFGDEVSVSIQDGKMTVERVRPDVVDADAVAWAKQFIEKYRPALEALKDR